jgi:starch synthase
MVGALAKALARAGNRVGVVTPLYRGIRERFPSLTRLEPSLELPLGARLVRGQTWTLDSRENLTVYFIEQPEFYDRLNLYQQNGSDYPDNAGRFLFFSKAAVHLASKLPWQPEVLHVNDWQAGFAPLLLQHQQKQGGPAAGSRTCMTIHNVAYQGLFPASQYPLTNLPWDYFSFSGAEFYGQMACLKTGIAFADVVTTVSPRYAQEITTTQFGCGLEGLLRHREGALFGILNGVDYEEWDPTVDPYIEHHYSTQNIEGKKANKLALQRELGLPEDPALPLFGNIGRLVEQKGVDIMVPALQEMLDSKLQFVSVGAGSPVYEAAFQALARRFPAQVAVRTGFDEGLSHRIEAGCDFFLMPSQFEPCGLNQMYSLRYGTIPIVRAVGGLDDTVIDPREDLDAANGIKFNEYSAAALAKAMRKALALFQQPELLEHFRSNGMAKEFSWDHVAEEYAAVYERAVTSHAQSESP